MFNEELFIKIFEKIKTTKPILLLMLTGIMSFMIGILFKFSFTLPEAMMMFGGVVCVMSFIWWLFNV